MNDIGRTNTIARGVESFETTEPPPDEATSASGSADAPPPDPSTDQPAPPANGDSLAQYGAPHELHPAAQGQAQAVPDDAATDTATLDAPPASGATEAAAENAQPPATPPFNERKRPIGNTTVKTHSEFAPADELRARQMTDLPQAKGFESVKSYVDAIGARDRRAQLDEAGDRRGARDVKRPPGIGNPVWDASLALEKEGISQDDVKHYLATDTLPDLLDEQGKVLMTGAQRMQKLDAEARKGSWTAVNSFTFLVGMRRAHLASEREALVAKRDALPADAPMRAELDAAIRGSTQLDKELNGKLQGLYKVASYAREAAGERKIDRASQLSAEADKAFKAKDFTKAKDLEAQATKLRNEGAVIAHHEAKYRASIKAFEPDRAYRLAAQAQIDTGAAKVESMAAWRTGLTEAPPSELGNSTEAQNSNGVPGAQALLTEAAKHDKAGGKNHSALALENAREGTLARFESLHVERSGYLDRVDDKGNKPVNRGTNAVEHRAKYLDARAEQSRVLMERLNLYGDIGALNDKDAAAAARVAADHANVTQELAATMGTALRSDNAVEQQKELAGQLDTEATKATERAEGARKQADEQAHQSSKQRDGASAVFGDTFKWSDTARRDHAAVADANMAEKVTADMASAVAEQAAQARAEALDAKDTLRSLEFQQGRDRVDAELARKAFAKAMPGGRTASIGAAYETARRSGDDSAKLAERAADQVRTQTADTALARLDAARYWTASTEVDRGAQGDIGKLGAPDRLAHAKTLIDRAQTTLGTLEAGSDGRAAVAAGIVDEKASLGSAIAEIDSREAHHQLSTAETIAVDELSSRPAELTQARGRIGTAAIDAVVRADGHLEEQLKAGTYDPNAKDQMYMQAGRLLYTPGLDSSAQLDAARLQHAKVKLALDDPMRLLESGMQQIERGTELATSLSGAMARGQIQAAQGPISGVISGPVWLFSGGNVDMKESLASTIEGGANTMINQVRGYTKEARQGLQDLQAGYAQARSEGQAFRYLDSLRIMSIQPNGTNPTRDAQYQTAKSYVKAHFAEGRKDSSEWSMFSTMAWNANTGAPVAHAIRQPLLSMQASELTLGDARLAVVANPQQFMLNVRRDDLEQTIDRTKNATRAKVIAEFALVLVTTRGMGGGAAAANATRAGVAAAEAAEAMTALGTLMRATAVFRQAHPLLYTAAATTVVGAGMTAVSYGAERLFGRGSPVAQTIDTVMDVMPIGAGHKFAGIGSAERRLATIEAQSLARAEKAFSWSALKGALGYERIVAHARFYAPQIALGVAQIEAARVLLPEALKAAGLERSEFAERALSVIFNTVAATGIAAVVNWKGASARNAQVAEQIVRATAEGRPAALTQSESARMQKAVQREIADFNKRTANRMPTGDEVAALKTAIGDRLGLDRSSDRGRIEADVIDGAVEALRVERATSLGTSIENHPTERSVHATVEAAAERLYASRGGEATKASRALAYRDAARLIADELGARATRLAQEPGKSAQADQLLQAQNWAGDRAAAVELAATTPGVGPREARRLENFYAAELGRARVLVDAPGAKDLSAHFAAAEGRAIKEAGVERDVAALATQQLRSEVFTQGIARQLTAQQVVAGKTPLSNVAIANASREMALRVGIGREGAELLSRDVMQSRATLERAGIVLAGGETQTEKAFRDLRANNRDLVDVFSNMDADTFVRAFGETPNTATLAQLAAVKGFRELAAADPARARAVLDSPPALSGQPGNVVDQLLVRGQPYAVGAFPADHTGVKEMGMSGRAVSSRDFQPSELPYRSELRTVVAAQPQLPNSLQQVPLAQVVRETDAVLYAGKYNGSGGVVRIAQLADGTPVAIKRHFNPIWEPLTEARSAKLLSDLGVGPRFHGIYRDTDGYINIVMDIVPGAFDGKPVTAQTFRDLDDMLVRFAAAGMPNLGDFQAFRTPEGRLLAIDPGYMANLVGQTPNSPSGRGNSDYADARLGLLKDADAAVGITYLNQLRAADPLAWKTLMEKMQERVTPAFEQRFGAYMQANQHPVRTRQP